MVMQLTLTQLIGDSTSPTSSTLGREAHSDEQSLDKAKVVGSNPTSTTIFCSVVQR